MTGSLLLRIARCGEVAKAHAQPDHRCHLVVRAQGTDAANGFVPERWSGNLSQAKILFVTANPSLDFDEQFPKAPWTDDLIVDFFERRFGGGTKDWTRDGSRVLRQDGCYSDPVQTWTELRNIASVIVGRRATPGEDYAVTDVVHCKSRNAIGVADAHDFCVRRYMVEILRAASARVLIALGPARSPQILP